MPVFDSDLDGIDELNERASKRMKKTGGIMELEVGQEVWLLRALKKGVMKKEKIVEVAPYYRGNIYLIAENGIIIHYRKEDFILEKEKALSICLNSLKKNKERADMDLQSFIGKHLEDLAMLNCLKTAWEND